MLRELMLSPTEAPFLFRPLVIGPTFFDLEASLFSDRFFAAPEFNASSDPSVVFEDKNHPNSSSLLRLPSPNVESQFLQTEPQNHITNIAERLGNSNVVYVTQTVKDNKKKPVREETVKPT